MKNKPFLAKREDGFTVSLAKWHDFPKFVESINDLSEESKSFYQLINLGCLRKIHRLKLNLVNYLQDYLLFR